ncbi:hypothetical protein LMG19087_04898 [Ralstonia wenshanensis]|uniref:hypothetical protein n=1 Tax=Ralstonia wenshanensis TaxID=2842456 RepID=UPI0028F69EEA|nr:hypothetical protein [Ralstonia wenshanensis]CAJ0822602.1 hypothetical protein LMG19087_04898 [Ralstonia wenshanensis]
MTTLYNIVDAVRPTRAFFSTYTYSAAWFEGTLFPLLRNQRGAECEQITVMLERRQSRHNLDSANSRFAGTRYRVIGVSPKAEGSGPGIFHPKVAYLESDEGDVFVVSSANLTIRGQGVALEVVDAVYAAQEPRVFSQVAEFFEMLPSGLNLLTPDDRAVLAQIAERARAQADKYADQNEGQESTWLVTTLTKSAGSQLCDLARNQLKEPKQLTVMSPFFDKDERAVSSLAKKLGTHRLQLGVSRRPGRREWVAPFADNPAWDAKVTPPAPENERPLHAKWFDIEDASGRALVMTGSVNATHQSLWMTKNVEVSLVRLVPKSTVSKWTKVTDPIRYEPCAYPGVDGESEGIQFVATLTAGAVLKVYFAVAPGVASVTVALIQNDRVLFRTDSEVHGSNVAAVKLPTSVTEKFSDSALWGQVTVGSVSDTTIVNREDSLRMRPSSEDLSSAVDRVNAGDDEDDDARLIAEAAHILLTGRARSPKGRGGKTPKGKQNPATSQENGEEDDSDEFLTEDEWLAKRSGSAGGAGPTDSITERALEAFGRLLEKEDEVIESRLGEGGDEPDGDDSGDVEDPDDISDDRAPKKRAPGRNGNQTKRANTIEAARLALDKRLERPGLIPDAIARMLLPLKIVGNLSRGISKSLRNIDTGVELSHEGSTQEHTAFLTGLLPTLAKLQVSPGVMEESLPLVVSAAATVSLCLSRRGGTSRDVELRAQLDTIAGRGVTFEQGEAYVRATWDKGTSRRIRLFKPDDLVLQLWTILGADSVTSGMDKVLEAAYSPGAGVAGEITNEQAPVVEALRRPPGKKKLYSVIIEDRVTNVTGCPQCGAVFTPEEKSRLRKTQIALCTGTCHRPVFVLTSVTAQHQFLRQTDAMTRDLRTTKSDGGAAAQ